ncbi:ABC transporter permease [Niabella drilacis]|uniref:Putative ABC transport system permease protein n=1 Tax=Niabella drilacis (strain DSM 25811 / CCM 8410 / CCUG 62505 / LMG 26954 / E90) TaxID=1285928 RepID=A0A1G7AIQ3_NIADE|nr:ABC transporter permease [Niabella drilacis]SDE14603.1 putative ABC transport system permease protein [Niabella drilacis]
MIKNYLKIAWRNITRRRLLSVVSILSLAMGFCFALVVGVYIFQQRSVNQQFKNINNQYIIKSSWKTKGGSAEVTGRAPFAKALKEEYPGLVEHYYRFNPVANVVAAGDRFFKENIAIGDTNFVSMYGLPVLFGNANHAFDNMDAAVITETMAKKLFDHADAIGKIISVQTVTEGLKQDYRVSAVLKDQPYNSVFNQGYPEGYNVFIPGEGCRYYPDGDPLLSWNNNSCVTMVELRNGVAPGDLARPSRQVLARHAPEFFQKNLTVVYAPVKDFYLTDNNNAVIKMIATYSIIAVFVLLMAVFNFINIRVATATSRIKEVGLRKVFGSGKGELVLQFLVEAWLLTAVSGFIALVFYQAACPWFSRVLGVNLLFLNGLDGKILAAFVLLVVLVGFLAGIYPAFSLSRSQIVTSVKGKTETMERGRVLRRVVLTLQFSMAILVFIGAAVVAKQVRFIFNRDAGYNKDQLLVVTAFPKRWDKTGVQKMESIKQELLKLPGVKSATLSFDLPDRVPVNSSVELLPVRGQRPPVSVPSFISDEDYGKTFELHMRAGSFLNDKKPFVPGQIVLNETAARLLELPIDNAVGKRLRSSEGEVFTVAGIVKDYNMANMREAITPLVIFHVNDMPGYRLLIIKLDHATGESVKRVRDRWRQLSPNAPFDYTFMDEKFAALYQSELQLKKATFAATVFCLLIVFAGIFSVVSVALSKREKEVAIRKVLGAQLIHIFMLFMKEYIGLLIIANLVSWPLAYYFITQWLAGYVYRIPQSIEIYLGVAAIVMLLVALLIITRTLETAIAGPAKKLKAE